MDEVYTLETWNGSKFDTQEMFDNEAAAAGAFRKQTRVMPKCPARVRKVSTLYCHLVHTV